MGWQSVLRRIRALWARPPVVAAVLVVVTIAVLTIIEVVPQYSVQRHRGEVRGRLDHPTFLIADCPYYRATLVSLLEDADLDIGNNLLAQAYYPLGHNVSQGKTGALYPKHPVLLAVAALPFYVVAGDFGLLAFNLAQLAGLALIMWLGARRYASDSAAFMIALWFRFGTCLRLFGYNFAPDVLSTLLAAGSIVALLGGRRALSGALFGLALWAKWSNLAFAPVMLAALALGRDWRGLLRWSLAAAAPALGLLALNHHMFGSPFITPYDRVLIESGGQLVLEPSHRTMFSLPFWQGLWQQLTDRELGLCVWAPLLFLLSLPGFVVLLRRARAEALLIAGACLAQLAFYAKYELWNHSHAGPRFLLTVIVLGALPAAALLARARPRESPQ